MTEPDIPKLILGPSASDDRAINERLADVEMVKETERRCCERCGEPLKGDTAIRMGVCGSCEEKACDECNDKNAKRQREARAAKKESV